MITCCIWFFVLQWCKCYALCCGICCWYLLVFIVQSGGDLHALLWHFPQFDGRVHNSECTKSNTICPISCWVISTIIGLCLLLPYWTGKDTHAGIWSCELMSYFILNFSVIPSCNVLVNLGCFHRILLNCSIYVITRLYRTLLICCILVLGLVNLWY